jgi:hypothetical protein
MTGGLAVVTVLAPSSYKKTKRFWTSWGFDKLRCVSSTAFTRHVRRPDDQSPPE